MNPIEYFTGPAHRAVVTSSYGMRNDPINPGNRRMHYGTDLDIPGPSRGHVWTSPYPGVVTRTATHGGRGKVAVIRIQGTRILQLFQHLDDYRCKVGDQINQGSPVGTNGTTGDVTGPHLHYELRIDDGSTLGSPVWGDPAKFIWEGDGMRKTHVVVSGDTLSKLAGIYGVSRQQIIDWNKHKYPDIGTGSVSLIRVGWVLYVEPDWRGEAEDLQKQLSKALSDLAKAKKEADKVPALQSANNSLQSQVTDLNKAISRLQDDLSRADSLAARVPGLEAEIAEYEGRVTDLLSEIKDLREKDADRERYVKLQDEVIDGLNDQVQKLESKVDTQADSIDNLVKQMQGMTGEFEALANENTDIREQLNEAKTEKAKLKNELARYENLLVMEFSWSHVVELIKALVGKLFRRIP